MGKRKIPKKIRKAQRDLVAAMALFDQQRDSKAAAHVRDAWLRIDCWITKQSRKGAK